jgi:rhodanese-related sulfurtransferase
MATEVAMPNMRRVTPLEAKQLVDEGYTYIDVRTEQEFDARHPAGALNVPLTRMGPAGPAPNADFVPLMRRLFALDAKIVVGCATGMRSRRAAEMLAGEGFEDVADQRAGLDGARSPFGGLQEPGWAAAGLPVATGPDAGSYEKVKARGTS